MKYASKNIFTDFEFHDAYFKFENFENDILTFSAKLLNIHKNTEQNPSNTDMQIELAKITFHNFQIKSYEPGRGGWKQDENGNWYTDEPRMIFEGESAKEKMLHELQYGTTVFEFGTQENGNHYFGGAGDEPWFKVQYSSDSVTIEWDAYKKPAWYEEKQFKKS